MVCVCNLLLFHIRIDIIDMLTFPLASTGERFGVVRRFQPFIDRALERARLHAVTQPRSNSHFTHWLFFWFVFSYTAWNKSPAGSPNVAQRPPHNAGGLCGCQATGRWSLPPQCWQLLERNPLLVLLHRHYKWLCRLREASSPEHISFLLTVNDRQRGQSLLAESAAF